MNNIITNEIKKLINRFPTTEEIDSCMQYIDDGALDDATADDISILIQDWFDDNMAQCENCGEYHLTNEMTKNPNGWFCDRVCEYEYDDKTYDLYKLESDEYRFNVLNH